MTQKENESLSFLTSNDQDGYKVLVSTDKKYDHLGITLFKRQKGKVHWKYVTPVETKALDVPEELLEYEKRYLVA